MSEELKMFHDDYSWAVAYSPADASLVCEESTGEEHDADVERWQELPPDAMTKMWCDADGKPCEIGEGTLTPMTNREWVARFGRGYIGSTEG